MKSVLDEVKVQHTDISPEFAFGSSKKSQKFLFKNKSAWFS